MSPATAREGRDGTALKRDSKPETRGIASAALGCALHLAGAVVLWNGSEPRLAAGAYILGTLASSPFKNLVRGRLSAGASNSASETCGNAQYFRSGLGRRKAAWRSRTGACEVFQRAASLGRATSPVSTRLRRVGLAAFWCALGKLCLQTPLWTTLWVMGLSPWSYVAFSPAAASRAQPTAQAALWFAAGATLYLFFPELWLLQLGGVLGVWFAALWLWLERRRDANATKLALRKELRSVVMYGAGLGLIAQLVWHLPFAQAWGVLLALGPVALTLFLTPLSWAFTNVASLRSLLKTPVSFGRALFVQLVGDGVNNIVPALGMGGEPLKVSQLAKRVPLEDASSAIVHDRGTHTTAQVLFGCAASFVVVSAPSTPAEARTAFYLYGALMTALSAGMAAALFSHLPQRFNRFLLTRLRVAAGPPAGLRVDRRAILKSLCFKFMMPLLKTFDLYLFMWAIDQPITAVHALIVFCALKVSASMFFFVPQGVGVNEASLSASFALLSLSPALGLTYGLMRRLRVLFWTLVGFGLLKAQKWYEQKGAN